MHTRCPALRRSRDIARRERGQSTLPSASFGKPATRMSKDPTYRSQGAKSPPLRIAEFHCWWNRHGRILSVCGLEVHAWIKARVFGASVDSGKRAGLVRQRHPSIFGPADTIGCKSREGPPTPARLDRRDIVWRVARGPSTPALVPSTRCPASRLRAVSGKSLGDGRAPPPPPPCGLPPLCRRQAETEKDSKARAPACRF